MDRFIRYSGYSLVFGVLLRSWGVRDLVCRSFGVGGRVFFLICIEASLGFAGVLFRE